MMFFFNKFGRNILYIILNYGYFENICLSLWLEFLFFICFLVICIFLFFELIENVLYVGVCVDKN